MAGEQVTAAVAALRADINEMCLVCEFHHREFEARGWRVRMRCRLPEWIPPPWLDPYQVPRRNTAHQPPDIDFDLVG